ncbi:VOC family protein [Pararhodonellum marinum]|uniref:hypothetical protein n=1 Tax=Pararhodonellum marinum TaxID=2755358 RepID=UPI00189050D4|nr:hypothetical protein [Pararhodonellum marinum]
MASAYIQTPTPNLQESRNFYAKLGFVSEKENPNLFTDGKAHIEINPDRMARLGICLKKDTWVKELDTISGFSKVLVIEGGHLIADPSGVWVYLLEKNLHATEAKEDFEGQTGVLGSFAGISIETVDMVKSLEFYNRLGFQVEAGAAESGYVSCQWEGFTLTFLRALNCPHLFFNPSLTYFNGKENPAIIQKVRDLQIPITEEITYFNKTGMVDNIILRDPGGLGFFVFND